MSVILNNRYRVIEVLGSGGFGKTFLAEDTHLPSNRKCVIKQLIFSSSDPQLYQLIQNRFQREAAILEMLGDSSEQIPKLYAYFSETDQFYLVQELIIGETLSKILLTRGQLDEQMVKELLDSLLLVLEFVHSQKIIHRDIKPENIILRQRDGKPVLIDFGAVKEVSRTVARSSGYASTSITIGTPGYMPLEQVAGMPVFASDLYSLSMTAIYLLTGKHPQELLDPANGNIEWHSHAPQVSSTLAAILDRAIQSNYRDRYASAREMFEELNKRVTSKEKSSQEKTTSPARKPADTVEEETVKRKPVEKKEDLFPLYGVTLGVTTVKELEKLGRKNTSTNSRTKEPYKYYIIKETNFWYDDRGIANYIYIARGVYSIPDKWKALGFDWSLSYNQWIKLVRKLGFSVSISTPPQIRDYNGHDSFSAKISASKKISGVPVILDLDFNYSQGTRVDSENTLYSITVRLQ